MSTLAPTFCARHAAAEAQRRWATHLMTFRLALALIAALSFNSAIAAAWPPDARIAISRGAFPGLKTKTVEIVRRCQDDGSSLVAFRFEYPELASSNEANRRVNTEIERSLAVSEELGGCDEVVARTRKQRLKEEVSRTCSAGVFRPPLLSLSCFRRGAVGPRPSGFPWFMTFNTDTGEEVAIAAMINDWPAFERVVRDQLLTENHEAFSEDLPYLDQVTAAVSRSCGFEPRLLTCSSLLGMHDLFDIHVPMSRIEPLLVPTALGRRAMSPRHQE